ncbi:MAG: hypothetical protein JRN42_08220 [Nitrososphaerota archaeon]|nr:hypothetical protein [Nitrososphaerota archaeon]
MDLLGLDTAVFWILTALFWSASLAACLALAIYLRGIGNCASQRLARVWGPVVFFACALALYGAILAGVADERASAHKTAEGACLDRGGVPFWEHGEMVRCD